MKDKYISVIQLTKYLKYKFDNDINLNEVFIRGEYLTLKHILEGIFILL